MSTREKEKNLVGFSKENKKELRIHRIPPSGEISSVFKCVLIVLRTQSKRESPCELYIVLALGY